MPDIVNFLEGAWPANIANISLKFVGDGLMNHYLFQMRDHEETKVNQDSSGKHLNLY